MNGRVERKAREQERIERETMNWNESMDGTYHKVVGKHLHSCR